MLDVNVPDPALKSKIAGYNRAFGMLSMKSAASNTPLKINVGLLNHTTEHIVNIIGTHENPAWFDAHRLEIREELLRLRTLAYDDAIFIVKIRALGNDELGNKIRNTYYSTREVIEDMLKALRSIPIPKPILPIPSSSLPVSDPCQIPNPGSPIPKPILPIPSPPFSVPAPRQVPNPGSDSDSDISPCCKNWKCTIF